jgi:hypothetical protein
VGGVSRKSDSALEPARVIAVTWVLTGGFLRVAFAGVTRSYLSGSNTALCFLTET